MISIWDRAEPEALDVLRGTGSYLYTVAISPNGDDAITGGFARVCHAWSLANAYARQDLKPPGRTFASAWSPSGSRVAIGGDGARLWVAQVERGLPQAVEFEGKAGIRGRVLCVAFLDERRLLLGLSSPVPLVDGSGDSAHAAVFDLVERRVTAGVVTGHAVEKVALLDERRAVLAQRDGTLSLVDLPAMTIESQVAVDDKPLNGLAISSDQTTLAVGTGRGRAELRDSRTLALVRALDEHPDRIWEVVFTGDGRGVVTACQDGIIRLFDTATGFELTQLRGHDNYVYDLAFTPDGSTLLSCSGDGTVRTWSTRPHAERYREMVRRSSER